MPTQQIFEGGNQKKKGTFERDAAQFLQPRRNHSFRSELGRFAPPRLRPVAERGSRFVNSGAPPAGGGTPYDWSCTSGFAAPLP